VFNLDALNNLSIEDKYKYMLILAEGQLSTEKDPWANISNISAIIKAVLDRCNWAGFYFARENELVLGPFQGLPACNRIKLGNGVCGAAVVERKVLRVANVHEFPGHIACDANSKSEIVVPIIKNDKVYGVLDIDSPEFNRFTELEERYLTLMVEKLNKYIQWENML
jgi:L-methionine (R)-S-oxide reductase